LSPYQSGFRAGHSTVTALLYITDDINRDLDEGLFVALVLLDTVNHSFLCQCRYMAFLDTRVFRNTHKGLRAFLMIHLWIFVNV
jgi:predicted double-glycine peptidase